MFEEDLLIIDKKIERVDRTKEIVAFYGSSSLRLWENLEQSLAPLNCINLGFGGSSIPDCIEQFDRVLVTTNPNHIFLYIGDNDIGNGSKANEVFTNFQYLFTKIRERFPSIELTYVSIKPSPSRMLFKSITEEANRLIKEMIEKEANSSFLDIYHPMLLENGDVDASLFIEDELHLNDKGYQLWTKLFRAFLNL